jgi:RNA recognition motif-containing protein
MDAAGPSKRTTVYVAGFAPGVKEQQLLDAFVTFGDILEISVPHDGEGGGE